MFIGRRKDELETFDLKEKYLYLLRECLVDAIYKENRVTADFEGTRRNRPLLPSEIGGGSYYPKHAHTMLSRGKLDNIKYCIEHCLKNDVPGDFLEAGAWRGGACIFAAGVFKANGVDRKVYVADSFEGMPHPDPKKYPQDRKDQHHKRKFLCVNQVEVIENFSLYHLLDENVVFVKGFFEHSLPKLDVESWI